MVNYPLINVYKNHMKTSIAETGDTFQKTVSSIETFFACREKMVEPNNVRLRE
jgi:hypothetical protein